MKLKSLALIFLLILSCNSKVKEGKDNDVFKVEAIKSNHPEINLEVYDFNGFKEFLNKKDDKIYVINFWATWCAPCVKELPYFEKLLQEYKGKGVEVILVSLDFPHLYESKLKPFILKNNLKSKVIALDDANENVWINKIDASWSGSIPATIIYNKDKSKFFERSFTYDELEKEVKQF